MITPEYVKQMAVYNQWMNAKVFAAAGELSPDALIVDRKAFFGSIIGTLNHIVVGDTLWLKRFATHPSRFVSLEPIRALERPSALGQILFSKLEDLLARRKMIDTVVLRWADELTDTDLSHVLTYTRMAGANARKPLSSLLVHFFNHQTHHRGQVTTLLSQAGSDVGETDVLALMPDVEAGSVEGS